MEKYRIFVRSMKVMGKRMYIYLAAIFIMSVTFSLFGVMSSLLMKSVVDIAQSGKYEQLPITIAIIVLVGIVSLLIYRKATICYNVEAKRVYGVLSEAVLEVEMSLPYSYYEKHHSGELVSKVSYDLTKMGDIYGSRLRRVVMPILQVIVYLVPMFIMSYQLTLCLVAVNIIMVVIEFALLNPMHRISKELSKVNTDMTSSLSDLLQGMEQVRMYELGEDIVDNFKAKNHEYAKKSKIKMLYTACLECSSNGFELLCSLVFLLIGIYFVDNGYTTLGSLAAIYTMYGSLAYQFLQVGKYVPELIGCLANAKNIFDFLDEEREPKNWYNEVNKDVVNVENNVIEAENITFSYDGNNNVLDGFSLNVKEGEFVAITGVSGCGKTTFSKLLLGLYPLNGGELRINGLDVKHCDMKDIRSQIAYVPQEPYLFDGSIIDNIKIGNEHASYEDVVEAAKLANAHDFIVAFENGYDTNVGERGNNLSGGQRQRISIARAILKKASIILMDEATSALDNESELLVNEALRNLQGKKTILMIAHRPSTIQLADRVCAMD